MNWSFTVVGDVPPDVMTRTSTAPGVSVAGDTAVIDVEELTTTPVAGVAPKLTLAPLMKLVPVMVTDVPPPVGDFQPALPVTAEAGIQAHQGAAAAVGRVAGDDVAQPLGVERVAVGRVVNGLAGVAVQLGLGVKALHVADATTQEDPDDRARLRPL